MLDVKLLDLFEKKPKCEEFFSFQGMTYIHLSIEHDKLFGNDQMLMHEGFWVSIKDFVGDVHESKSWKASLIYLHHIGKLANLPKLRRPVSIWKLSDGNHYRVLDNHEKLQPTDYRIPKCLSVKPENLQKVSDLEEFKKSKTKIIEDLNFDFIIESRFFRSIKKIHE